MHARHLDIVLATRDASHMYVTMSFVSLASTLCHLTLS
jgi:hypothetical protein